MKTTISLIFLSVMVTGCANEPEVSDVNNYLTVQAELIKLNSYRTALLNNRDKLTAVIPELNVPDPEPPETHRAELGSYLANNDCLVSTDFGYCYQVSRIKLIKTTQALEHAEYMNYVSLVTINSLIRNINIIIDTLADSPEVTDSIIKDIPIPEQLFKVKED